MYADGLYNIKNVMESSDCHTLDRHDWRAQKEDCNVSTAEDWDRAVSDLFNLNHWPYVNGKDENIRNCIKMTFKDSPENLKKDMGTQVGLSITLLLLGLTGLLQ